MELSLYLHYVVYLALLGLVVLGLGDLKRRLLRLSAALSKNHREHK